MLDRTLVVFALGLSALTAGCLLDAGPYSGDGGSGASINHGGSGGSGGTTMSTTTGTTGGSGGMTTTSSTTTSSTTTSTTTTDTTCPSGCDDGLPCTQDVCSAGTCMHPPLQAGTFVSNNVATDCQKEVCDGSGGVTGAADDTETPNMIGGDCDTWKCVGGVPMDVPLPDGTQCFGIASGPCESGTQCVGGQCVGIPVSGTFTYGQCGTVTCSNGAAISTVYSAAACQDPTPTNCRVPDCGPDGNGVPICYPVNAPQGQSCIKSNDGQSGSCNNSGHCCNDGGQSCD